MVKELDFIKDFNNMNLEISVSFDHIICNMFVIVKGEMVDGS